MLQRLAPSGSKHAQLELSFFIPASFSTSPSDPYPRLGTRPDDISPTRTPPLLTHVQHLEEPTPFQFARIARTLALPEIHHIVRPHPAFGQSSGKVIFWFVYSEPVPSYSAVGAEARVCFYLSGRERFSTGWKRKICTCFGFLVCSQQSTSCQFGRPHQCSNRDLRWYAALAVGRPHPLHPLYTSYVYLTPPAIPRTRMKVPPVESERNVDSSGMRFLRIQRDRFHVHVVSRSEEINRLLWRYTTM